MGKKKPTRPVRALKLVPTPPERTNLLMLDQQASDELKALIKKITGNGKRKRTPDEDPQLPPAA